MDSSNPNDPSTHTRSDPPDEDDGRIVNRLDGNVELNVQIPTDEDEGGGRRLNDSGENLDVVADHATEDAVFDHTWDVEDFDFGDMFDLLNPDQATDIFNSPPMSSNLFLTVGDPISDVVIQPTSASVLQPNSSGPSTSTALITYGESERVSIDEEDPYKEVPPELLETVPVKDREAYKYLYMLHHYLTRFPGASVGGGFRFDNPEALGRFQDRFAANHPLRPGWLNKSYRAFNEKMTQMGIVKIKRKPIWLHPSFHAQNPDLMFIASHRKPRDPTRKQVNTRRRKYRRIDTSPDIDWTSMIIYSMVHFGIDRVSPSRPFRSAIIDISTPPLGTRMQIGHLSSLVVGDTMAKLLRYCNVDVELRSTIGDFGPLVGALVLLLVEINPHWDTNLGIPDSVLHDLVKTANKKYSTEPAFKVKAHQSLTDIQVGAREDLSKALDMLRKTSRGEVNLVKKNLGVVVNELGISDCYPYFHDVLTDLGNKGFVQDLEGSSVVALEGKISPFTFMDREGLFLFDAVADLTALRSRLQAENAECVIYISGNGRAGSDYYKNLCSIGKYGGWFSAANEEIPVLKFVHTAGNNSVPSLASPYNDMVKLLDEAKKRCKVLIDKRRKGAFFSDDEIDQAEAMLGFGAVRYGFLKGSKKTGHAFWLEDALLEQGNTAVALQDAHACVCNVVDRSRPKAGEPEPQTKGMEVYKGEEQQLATCIRQFPSVVKEACLSFEPSVLCDYLCDLSKLFQQLVSLSRGKNSTDEDKHRKFKLCQATQLVLGKGMELLGMERIKLI